MASTRSTLESIEGHLEESIGARAIDLRPRLSPVLHGKDTSRRPLRNFGRVDIHQVIPDPDQPRVEFSEEAIERLAHSIREKGQLSPIRVRWSDELAKWVIIAGERRWRATKAAGLPTIDCYFHEGDLSRSEVLEQQLIENLLREDLRPVEEARAFTTLMELNGWNGKQVAEALRLPASRVSRALALLKLPDDIQEQVDAGRIPAYSAYEISRLGTDETRRELASQAVAGSLTYQQAAKAVRQRRGKPKEKPRSTKLTFPTENGWKVVVSANKKGTYHEVEQALEQALEDVRTRIKSNIQLAY
jgi:ParB family chromosome partitioning protein